MTIRIQLFALARDLAGADAVTVQLRRPATVADARRALVAAYPAIGPLLARSLLAINEQYARETDELEENQQVACIPPVSGG